MEPVKHGACPPVFTWVYVEDSEADSCLLRTILSECCPEMELIVFQDGMDALTSLSANCKTPDLILLDVILPDLDGVELIRCIRGMSRYAATPLVVFSGSREEEKVRACYRAGASCYVFKSGDLETIIENVQGIARFWCESASRDRSIRVY